MIKNIARVSKTAFHELRYKKGKKIETNGEEQFLAIWDIFI